MVTSKRLVELIEAGHFHIEVGFEMDEVEQIGPYFGRKLKDRRRQNYLMMDSTG